tara:strand:- start:2512 stop:2670 length:159 start_codon:yes stop_codon:yes gene_type:complete
MINKNDITGIIDILRKDKFYGAGIATEIAKGKNAFAYDWKQMKNKLIRKIKA